MGSPKGEERKLKKPSGYWLAPLVAGGCLATGYGVTQRLLILHNNWKEPTIELFQYQQPFPGSSLRSLRAKNGSTKSSLLADIALQEAKLEAQRKAETQAKLEAQRKAETESKELRALYATKEKEIQKALEALDTNLGVKVEQSWLKLESGLMRLSTPQIPPESREEIFSPKTFNKIFQKLPDPS